MNPGKRHLRGRVIIRSVSIFSLRKTGINVLAVLVGMFLLGGCALTPKPPLVYQAGAIVETLSAAASLSISKGDQGMSSSGYLLYQRPDKMRLVILSPFGTTLMEAIMVGESVTIVNTSKAVAFSGRLDELPVKGEGETWRQARWVMETDSPGSSVRDGALQRVNSLGASERVVYENGLISSKTLSNGDMVRYNDYELINGVPLATEIIMDSHDGGRFRIKVTEPEVNAPLSREAFLPRLDGLTLYPLAALQEIP